jgi:hypothetical protein
VGKARSEVSLSNFTGEHPGGADAELKKEL